MKTVFLFPGQGAQYPGMAKDLYLESSEVRRFFELASDVLSKDMKNLLFDSDEEVLKKTENTQAAVTLTNISAAQVLTEKGIQADLCAGFSVGEYAALYHSGIIGLEDLFRIVAIRGEVMEASSRKHDSLEGPSAMSAVLGLDFSKAKQTFEALARTDVFIANHSSPTQIVIAGTAQGLAAAETALSAAGAMKVVRLKVSGPFHSPLLLDAADLFAEKLRSITFSNPRVPVVSNVNAQYLVDGAEAKRLARDQIISMVRWVDTMDLLVKDGAGKIYEVGPGKVLGGLWRSFSRETKCQQAGTMNDIGSLLV